MGSPLISSILKARCSVEGCIKEERARGLCHSHYDKWLYHSNPNFRKKWIASISAYQKKRRINQRSRLFEVLGQHSCQKCGINDKRVLQFDHIYGNGRVLQKRMGGNSAIVKYYLDHPEVARKELQVLCSNCNWIKRCELQEVPYKDKEVYEQGPSTPA